MLIQFEREKNNLVISTFLQLEVIVFREKVFLIEFFGIKPGP